MILAALLLAPSAIASTEPARPYVVAGNGFGGGDLFVQNGDSYAPSSGSSVVVDLDDVSAGAVGVRVCHEWTYDDGSHADVRCARGCATSFSDPLRHPPWPHNTTYRVIVDLRFGPEGCAKATAGTMRVSIV